MLDRTFRIITIDDSVEIHDELIRFLPQNNFQTDLNISGTTLTQDNLPKIQVDNLPDPNEALNKILLAVEHQCAYSLVFLNIKIPLNWDDIEIIQQIWAIDGDIQLVICIAEPAAHLEAVLKKLPLNDNLLIIKKPFDDSAIKQLTFAMTKKWLSIVNANQNSHKIDLLVEKRTESLGHSLDVLRATLESTGDGILVLDLQGKILNYNSKFTKIWALSFTDLENSNEKEILGHMVSKLQKPDDFLRNMHKLKKNMGTATQQLVEFKDNKSIVECRSQPYLINGCIVGAVWVFRDITERINLEHKLEFQATHDPLTNLPNRVLLNDRISQCSINADRHKNHFAILFFDLDRFKLINDSLSHDFGDQLLRAVAKRLALMVRAGDTLARFGGDEFVMIASALNTLEDAVNVAHKVLGCFQQSFRVQGKEINLRVSIGIAVYPPDGKTSKELLRNADLAMYHAKERGGDQFRFYTSSLNQHSMKRLNQEAELKHALANNQFSLLYQPQYDVSQQKCLSAEALIRWNHPEKGVILPMDFIPAAEAAGLIIPLGEWVIEEVCKQHKAWRELGLPPIRIAINVALHQLRQFNFASNLDLKLQAYNVPPDSIDIEITENLILVHNEITHMINELKNIGVRVVIDDFGTAHSSLNYLKKLRIDGLKIDPSFIKNISESENDEAIIKAIIAMAKNLNFNVFAEGVETQKQIIFLQEQHCDGMQGYHFSRPIPADKVTEIFKNAYTNR